MGYSAGSNRAAVQRAQAAQRTKVARQQAAAKKAAPAVAAAKYGHEIPTRSKSKAPSGVSMHKWNRGEANRQMVLQSRWYGLKKGGQVAAANRAYVKARGQGRTIAESKSYARAIGNIRKPARRRMPAGSGEAMANVQIAKVNKVNVAHGFKQAPQAIIFRPSEIAKGWHKLPAEQVRSLRKTRLEGLARESFLKSSTAAVVEARRQRSVRQTNILSGVATGTITANINPITGKMMSQTVNTISDGQPIGNTLDYARARQIAEKHKIGSGSPASIDRVIDKTKKAQVEVEVYDSAGNVIGRTTTQQTKEIAYGGLMSAATKQNQHWQLNLGGTGELEKAYQSPYMQSLLYTAGYGFAAKDQTVSKTRGEQNLQGLWTTGTVQQGPQQPKQKHALETIQSLAKTHLENVQKTPWLYPPLAESRAGATLTLLSLGVGIVNLQKQVTSYFQKQKIGVSVGQGELLEIEKEPSGEFLHGLISKTVETGGDLGAGFSEGGTRFLKTAKEFGVLGTIGNIGIYAIPGGNIPKPIIPFSIMTSKGPVIASKVLAIPLPRQSALVFGGKASKEFGGKYFLGKPKFTSIPYQKRYDIPPMSRGFEHIGTKAPQQSIFRSHLPQLEKAALVKSGSLAFEKSAQVQARVVRGQKFELEKTLPKRILEQISTKEQPSIVSSVARQQKKYIDPAKGSLLLNLVKSRAVPTSVGLEQTVKGISKSRSVQRDILRVMKEKKLQRKIGDLDLDEIKPGYGVIAAKNILKESKLDPGKTLSRKGSNIFIESKIDKTSKEIINIPAIRAEGIEAIEAGSLGLTPLKGSKKVWGMKYPTKVHDIGIPGAKEKLKILDPTYQSLAKKVSMTALQSKASLMQTRGLTETTAKKMLGGARTAMSPFGPRALKDPVDDYMLGLKSIKISLEQGKFKQAAGTAKHLELTRKYYDFVPWDKAISEWKPTLEFGAAVKTLTKGKGGSISLGEISSSTGRPLDIGLRGTSQYGSPLASINLTPESPILTKPLSKGPSLLKLSKSESVLLPKSSTSLLPKTSTVRSSLSKISSPSRSIRSPYSPRSIRSPHSPGSINSILSPKSIQSPRSPGSVASIFSPKSPGPSPLSPKPSPLSPGSPITPSPGSPKIPSPGSPGSPGSPRPGKPISPLIPKTPLVQPPSLRQPPGAALWLRTRTDRGIKRPRKYRADFLGSTHVARITGFRSKQDIIYGRLKTESITRKDIKKSAKGKFGASVQKRPSLMSKHINLIRPSTRKTIRL